MVSLKRDLKIRCCPRFSGCKIRDAGSGPLVPLLRRMLKNAHGPGAGSESVEMAIKRRTDAGSIVSSAGILLKYWLHCRCESNEGG